VVGPGILGNMLSQEATERAFETGAAAVRTDRDLVVVAGPDASSYLHGQLSQNTERMTVGDSAWSLLLSPQGRIDAWLRVSKVDDEIFWLDVDSGFGEPAKRRLEMFLLRTNCTIDLVPTQMVAVRGPAAGSVEDARVKLGGSGNGTFVASVPWPGVLGFDVIGEKSFPPSDIEEGSPAALETLRIRLGIPRMGTELGEKTIPAEAGIVARSADFGKGCYVGQELVARVDSRGNNTPRSVLPVSITGEDVPPQGTELILDGDPIGVVTSAALSNDGVVALASVKRGFSPPFTASVEINGEPRSAEVSAATC